MEEAIRPITIIGFGGPGTGKSCLLNFLLDGLGSPHFKSSNSACSGVTKEISSVKCQALGIHEKQL